MPTLNDRFPTHRGQAESLISQLLAELPPLADQVRTVRMNPELRPVAPMLILSALRCQGVLVTELIRTAAEAWNSPPPIQPVDFQVTVQGRVYTKGERTYVAGDILDITPPAALKPGDRLVLNVWEEQDGTYVSCHHSGRYLLTVQPAPAGL